MRLVLSIKNKKSNPIKQCNDILKTYKYTVPNKQITSEISKLRYRMYSISQNTCICTVLKCHNFTIL